ncbi:MAG: sugar phosphate isomerase/epimerase family protein [Ruthenibacterium sp.]
MWDNIQISGFADEIDPDLTTQLEVLSKLNIHAIEMRGVNGRNITDLSLAEVEKVKVQLEKAHIKLSSIGSPIGKIAITDDFEPHFALYQHTVEIAKILQAPYLRMFSFFIPQGVDAAPYQPEVFRRMERFVNYAAQQNVVLMHENEKDIYGDIAPRCAEIMRAFYGEHLKAVFDFANFVQTKQDTIEAYELLRPYIAYIHIKDAKSADGAVVPAGTGDGNVAELLKRFKFSGYQGFLSLEPHLADFSGFHALEKDTVLNRKMTGEESFTLAYHSLQQILDALPASL